MAYRVKVRHRGPVGLRVVHDRSGTAKTLSPGDEAELEVSDREAEHFVLRSDKGDDVQVADNPVYFDEKEEDKVRAEERAKGSLKVGMFMDNADKQRERRRQEDARLREEQERADREKAEAEAAAAEENRKAEEARAAEQKKAQDEAAAAAAAAAADKNKRK
jgi:hypothetical protein